MSFEDTRPAVYLVGPTMADGAALRPLAEALKSARYDARTWSPAQQGLGGAGSFRRRGSALADHLRARTGKAIVFGWSNGAFVAVHAARFAPGSVRQLVLYEPPFESGGDPSLVQRLRFARMVFLAAIGRRRAAQEAFWRLVTARRTGVPGIDRLDPRLRRTLIEPRPHSDALLSEVFAGTGAELAREASGGEATILLGGESPTSTVRAAVRTQRLFRASSLVPLRGLDHLGPIAAPSTVAAAFEASLERA